MKIIDNDDDYIAHLEEQDKRRRDRVQELLKETRELRAENERLRAERDELKEAVEWWNTRPDYRVPEIVWNDAPGAQNYRVENGGDFDTFTEALLAAFRAKKAQEETTDG